MYYKRTLIMSDINDRLSAKKGILTLENAEGKVKGQLRLYNFRQLPQSIALGITSGSEIYKVPLKVVDNIVDFDVEGEVNLQEKLSCAMVDVSDIMSPKILIGGTSNYLNNWADRVEQAFVMDAKTLERDEMYENNMGEIEKEIESVIADDKEYKDCSMCTHCKYKEAFFEAEKSTQNAIKQEETPQKDENLDKINEILSNATRCDSKDVEVYDKKLIEDEEPKDSQTPNEELKEEQTQDSINDNIEETDKPSENEGDNDEEFYEQIKDQIDDLFKNHNREEGLENLIPNSKWVKVEYEDAPGHYVMGLIYDGDKIRFISYGLPSSAAKNPPKDLEGYAQWVQTTEDNSGYWLVYQSAKDGESVKVV